MDASELGRWTRFAGKGGIGKCTALEDCIAEQPQDLMFMKVSFTFSRLLFPVHPLVTRGDPRQCATACCLPSLSINLPRPCASVPCVIYREGLVRPLSMPG